MKRIMLLVLFLCIPSVATGEVSTRVCEADGNTPFDGRDIMVGTRLTIIVDSNVAGYWDGSLAIMGEDVNSGVLSARGPQVGGTWGDWSGSHFSAAGNEAGVYDLQESGIDGFDFYTGSTGIETGDWFIIDYNATDIGDCNVAFFDGIDYDPPYDPDYYIEFSHVRTRDFNLDTKVNFGDFAILTSYWQETNCTDPNWCGGTDLDINGTVDTNDLILFCDYWLESTQ